jgi:hypothetical protein
VFENRKKQSRPLSQISKGREDDDLRGISGTSTQELSRRISEDDEPITVRQHDPAKRTRGARLKRPNVFGGLLQPLSKRTGRGVVPEQQRDLPAERIRIVSSCEFLYRL